MNNRYTGSLSGNDDSVIYPVEQEVPNNIAPVVNSRISTLSGPDRDDVNPISHTVIGSLSGPDSIDVVDVPAGAPRTSSPGAGGSVSGAGTGIEPGGMTHIGLPDPYYFYGTMSDQVLHNYLDMAIREIALCNPDDPSQYLVGPSTGVPNPSDNEYQEDMDMLTDIQPKMIFDIAGQASIGVEGDTGYDGLQAMFARIQLTVTALKMADPDIICGASMEENINVWWTNNPVATAIPYYVFYDLQIYSVQRVNSAGMTYTGFANIPAGFGPTSPDYKTALSAIFFDATWMQRPNGPGGDLNDPPGYPLYPLLPSNNPPTGNTTTPDITLIDTQLFYYYLATQYIDNGCEMLFWADYWNVNPYDAHGYPTLGLNAGNQSTWMVLKKIREWGTKYARRGLVLIGAQGNNDKPYYYDDPTLPDILTFNRPLLFDFLTWRTGVTRPATPACTTGYQPLELTTYGTPLGQSPGGMHPQGWICAHIPLIIDFDRGQGADVPDPGCDFGTFIPGFTPPSGFTDITSWHVPCSPTMEQCYWGWDGISWFASQGDINNPANHTNIRNQILIYLYYMVKCYDPYAHFMMTGRMEINKFYVYPSATPPPQPMYRANTSTLITDPNRQVYQQQQTIKDIWNGLYAGPNDWVQHNFTYENVADTDIPPLSDLIFVGTNKIYFIGQDNYIHGYIYSDGTYNGGTWLTVSPSYAANVPAGSQVMAKSDLVASPDGSRLLYIGVDGYIHGFTIDNVWTYTYFDFFQDTSAIALCCLIYPTNNSVYYIDQSISDGTQRVYGFILPLFSIRGAPWEIMNPSYEVSESLAGQFQAAGGLTYDSMSVRLYYRGTNGLLAYIYVFSLTDYFYAESPGNALLQSEGVEIVGNIATYRDSQYNRIYFVGRYGSSIYSSTYYIYCLVEDTITENWSFINVSDSADVSMSSQMQADQSGQIAVSPDGNTIAYYAHLPSGWSPILPYICFLYYGSSGNFSYQQMLLADDTLLGYNSFQFINSGDIYFIAPYPQLSVNHLKYEEAYCENDAVTQPPCFDVVFPTVTIYYDGLNWHLIVTFTSCSSKCNEWTISFFQDIHTTAISAPDSGTRNITVDCSSLPYIVDILIHPYLVPHGSFSCTYGFTLTSCCGNSNMSSVYGS